MKKKFVTGSGNLTRNIDVMESIDKKTLFQIKLVESLRDLDAVDCLVFWAYLHGMSFESISKQLGWKKGQTAKYHYEKAVKKFREVFGV